MSNVPLTSLINDARIRGYFFQVLILALVVFGVWSLVDNTVTNLAERGKSVGFGFLTATSGFQISGTLGTWVMDYNVGKSTYLDVYFIGIINTFNIIGTICTIGPSATSSSPSAPSVS